jgi:chromosome partitioning protein
MKSITVATLKGGVGKTSFAYNLTGMLAKEGHKVLIIDTDIQTNITNNMNVDTEIIDYDHIGTILGKVLEGQDISPELVVVKAPLDFMPRVDIIPSHMYLSTVEMRMISSPIRHKLLKKYIDKHKYFFEKYDFIILDTNPSFSLVNINALYFSDSIILVTDIGVNSLAGAEKVYEEWNRLCSDFEIENKINGLVINKYKKTEKISSEVVEYIKSLDILQELSFETLIPNNVKLAETELVKKPIAYYDTKNAGYTAYIELVKELKEREVI